MEFLNSYMDIGKVTSARRKILKLAVNIFYVLEKRGFCQAVELTQGGSATNRSTLMSLCSKGVVGIALCLDLYRCYNFNCSCHYGKYKVGIAALHSWC